MKKIILLFSLALVSSISIAQTKVGTIDVEYIIAQMPQITQVNDSLKIYSDTLKSNLENSINEYETLVKDYQETNATLTEEEKTAKEKKIITLENSIKGFRQKAGVLVQLRRNELTKPLYEIINEAMQQVIKKEGYTQILNASGSGLTYFSPKYDITLKVLDTMGIEVKPAE